MTAKHTPGPWAVQEGGNHRWVVVAPNEPHEPFVAIPAESDSWLGRTPERVRANADLIAAAPALADALETYVADADVSSESYDRVAEEFRRDTGFLAPGKDEAAAVNSGVTHEERSHAWHIWVGKRLRARLDRARAALRAAGRLP